ncbi:MAG: hypothetical protein AAB475_00080 [Patescibacteria group bacterium]
MFYICELDDKIDAKIINDPCRNETDKVMSVFLSGECADFVERTITATPKWMVYYRT